MGYRGGMENDRLVKCVDCGFLALRTTEYGGTLTSSYYEISRKRRSDGTIWAMFEGSRGEPIRVEPFCFRAVADLRAEIDSIVGPNNEPTYPATTEIFNRLRRCDAWYRYNAGLTPKDHFEMLQLEILEKSRREFEERLQKDKKEFDERLEKSRKQDDRFNKKMNWFFAILAILSLIGTIAQLAFPDGIPAFVRLFAPAAKGSNIPTWSFNMPR
jgi:hypothetical protein